MLLARTRWLFALLLALTVASCAPERNRRASVLHDGPRHLVLVTVDTLRADRLGAYGYPAARTPHIDLLAQEALRFDRAYAHSSSTLPSIASLLTGKLPGEHGVYSNLGELPEQLPTLATRLQEEGFATGAFVGNFVLRPSRRLDRGFDDYTEEYSSREAVRAQPENEADVLTDAAISWLEERDPDERLFLWVHYQEPHGPYTPATFDPPAETQGLVLGANEDNSGRGGIPKYQWLGHGRLAEYQARYDAEIAEVDRQLGRLLEALEARGILDDGVLVFAADHGEAFGEEDLYCAHGEGLGEALLRVPLLLRVAGAAAGERDDVVRLIDVAPTALDLLGVEHSDLAGESLLEQRGDRAVVAQLGVSPKKRWRSLREAGFELSASATSRPSLRALDGERDASPEQKRRLLAELERQAPWPAGWGAALKALSPESREALRKLTPEERAALSELSRERLEALKALDPEEREALRALGYVD